MELQHNTKRCQSLFALLHKVAKIVRFLSGGEDMSQDNVPTLRAEEEKLGTAADIALQHRNGRM